MAGNERLSYEIAAIYSGSPEIKKAFDDFARLNAQGQRVVNQLERMGNQVKKTGEEIRNSRQGAAQLGMQFNQLGTQVASGTSVFTALAQQIGDVGYALSFMDGRLGAVGRFLAGPWGAAIGIAAVALGPLINNLFAVSEETKNAEDAAKDLDAAVEARKGSEESLRLALAKTAKEYLNIRLEMQRNALIAVRTAGVELQARLSVLRGLQAEQAILDAQVRQAGSSRGMVEMASGQAIQRYQIAQQTADAISAVTAQVANLEKLTAKLNASTINVVGAGERVSREAERGARASTQAGRATESRIESEQNAYDRLAERLRSIVTLRTAESEAIGRAKNELAEFDQLVQDIAKMTVGGELVGARLIGQMEPQIQAVRKQLVEATLGMQEYMTAIPPMSAAAEEAFKRQKDAIDSVGMSVANAFKGMLTAGASWKDGMKGIIQTVIDELWRLFVVQQIVGMVSSAIGGMFGGGGLSKKDPLAKAFDAALPGRAIGGSVTSNTPYLVGEKGPEIFVPGGNGTIIPNKNMGGASGAPTINVTVDARGSADPAAVRAQVQQGILEAAPAIVAAAQQRTVAGLRRPKLGGVMQ